MGLTLIEKILLFHTEKKKLENFIYAKVDFCFGNDVTAPLAVKIFKEAGFSSVFNPKKIAFVCDHFLPAKDIRSANNVKILKEFAQKFKVNFYDINQSGIEHVFLVEKGFIKPGSLIIGADSHTSTLGALGCAAFGVGSTDLACAMYEGKVWLKVPKVIKFIYKGKRNRWVRAKDLILYTIGKIGVDGALYKVMEFHDKMVNKLTVEERFTICNMAVEAGAKTGIFEPDEKTLKYLERFKRFKVDLKRLKSDKNAQYEDIIEIDVSKLDPQVAVPHLPQNVKPVNELRNVEINQVFVGSCTNGRLSDLKDAAKVLRGKKVKKGIRAILIPATPLIYKQALQKGIIKVFLEAGFVICPPNCGPCLGGHFGVLDKHEVALVTTNRNFIGRMGHPESKVYLCSPLVAAASAIKGRIAHPGEVL